MKMSENIEMILDSVRYEQAGGSDSGLTLALGRKGWVAKFVWHGPTLKATAGTAEQAVEALCGLVGQRNCEDARRLVNV